ncbi:MAG: hypothetical protein IID63_05155 [candidate division Zixibacteria bacterium]|nr:hypothetical protein [candidate division Zixibacteria bacterium]
MKTLTLIFLLLSSGISTMAQNPKTIESNNNNLKTGQLRLEKPERAAKRALQFTGIESRIDTSSASSSVRVEKVIINDDVTPFLSNKINGREIWRVLYTDVDFRRSLLLNDSNVTNLRDIEVLLDPVTGQLLRIIVLSNEFDSLLKPEPSAQRAEEHLKRNREIYHDFIEGLPAISFINAIYASAGCQPRVAKKIIAQLVLLSRDNGEFQEMWCFTTRGLRPMAGFHGSIRSVDGARCVVDATTGQWLGVTSAPHY